MAIHGGFCARDIVYFAYILKEILACLVSYLYAKYTISRAQNSPWIAIKGWVRNLFKRSRADATCNLWVGHSVGSLINQCMSLPYIVPCGVIVYINVGGRGWTPHPPPMRVFVWEKNREAKSNLKMKGGGERNQIIARIYAPEWKKWPLADPPPQKKMLKIFFWKLLRIIWNVKKTS